MAGGELMEQDTARTSILSKPSSDEDYFRLSLSTGYCSDSSAQQSSREIRHLNSAIYIESFYDDTHLSDQNPNEYHLDLSNCNDSVSVRLGNLNTKVPRSPSCTEIRYINPAIFIQTYESNENSSGDDSTVHLQNGRKSHKERKGSTLSRSYQNENSDELIDSTGSSTTLILEPREGTKSGVQHVFPECDNTTRVRGLSFDEWLALKHQEKVQKKINPEKSKECEETEKQKRLEKQREEFKVWLARKKEIDKRKKEQEESELQKIRYAQELKLKRASERDVAFKAWVKRKEEIAKEKKRREEEEIQKREGERKQRQERSVKAFENWVVKSKYNPRPVPLNMGVESLRGSVSSMFINPTPWQENIDRRRPTT